jgi:hypothetical protein
MEINNFQDLHNVKVGDTISYNGESLKVNNISRDQDQGGMDVTFEEKAPKYVTINHLGDVRGYFGKFNTKTSSPKIKIIKKSGGKSFMRRNKKSKNQTSRKRRTKRRYY